MSKNITQEKYENLNRKYKQCSEELEKIKNTRIYRLLNNMPMFIKNWAFKDCSTFEKEKVNLCQDNINTILGKVSIIINSYNCRCDISFLINSILHQNYINFEIIILCQNEENFKNYLNLDNRIILKTFANLKENSNINENINSIYDELDSEYIFYIDNKNKLSKKFIKRQIGKLSKDKIGIVYTKNNDILLIFMKTVYIKSFFDNYYAYDKQNLKNYDYLGGIIFKRR